MGNTFGKKKRHTKVAEAAQKLVDQPTAVEVDTQQRPATPSPQSDPKSVFKLGTPPPPRPAAAPSPGCTPTRPLLEQSRTPTPVPKYVTRTNPLSYNGLSINTYWKNLPPLYTDVYWLYSTRTSSGADDNYTYYFMSKSDSDALENAYNNRYGDCHLSSHSVCVNFNKMMQRSTCGGIKRCVRRLTTKEYAELKQHYLDFMEGRTWLWCLDCASGYVLYSPHFQEILDEAWEHSKNVTVRLNSSYSYYVDLVAMTQRNTSTGKTRRIARVLNHGNNKPILGSFLTKIEPRSDPMEESCMDYSTIYKVSQVDHL